MARCAEGKASAERLVSPPQPAYPRPSMLTGFSVENYRAFAERTEIELRPLTLLFGYNNAGKSALVRALALIADSTRADAAMPLDLSSEAARECTFDEIRSKLGESNTLKVGVSFDGADEQLRCEFDVTQPAGTFEQIVMELRFELASSLAGKKDSWQLDWVPFKQMVNPGAYMCFLNGQQLQMLELHFGGLVPTCLTSLNGLDRTGDEEKTVDSLDCYAQREAAFQKLAMALRTIGRDVRWIGSLRRYPPRFVQYRGGARARINPDGSGVTEILAHDKLTGGGLLREVSAWYEQSFKRKLDVVQSPDNRFSVTLEPLMAGAGCQINIADTGEGMVQVLPILVSAAMGRQRAEEGEPSILALEQPELHLHPAVHAHLADYLCGIAARDASPCMLIETHSENFLLGVQIQIVKKSISPHDVLVYWVRQLDDGISYAQRIELDEEGYPRGFPENVFNEDLELARILLDLREQAGR